MVGALSDGNADHTSVDRQFYEREFTLYETQYYRDTVLKAQIPTHQIEAYPLPEAEAETLFGPVVSQNFFAVRLTINNNDDNDKLINTGLIVAHGRALVEPNDSSYDKTTPLARPDEPVSYTVSVAVAPQSDKQMFTVLDDTQVNSPRNWIFRGLDFVGALGTAIVNVTSAPGVATQAAGLFTGTFTPAARQLFPDSYDAYKRNIVAYAMPELIKVPRRSSVGHRYLFFSKNEMQGLIMNQSEFGPFPPTSSLVRGLNSVSQIFTPPLLTPQPVPTPPQVALVSLQFDHLEIPFELVVGSAQASVRDRIDTLRNSLPSKQVELETLASDWTTASTKQFLLTGLTTSDLAKASGDLAKLIAKLGTLKTAEKDTARATALGNIADALGFFKTLAQDLTPTNIKQDLLQNKVYGTDAVKKMISDAQNLSTQIISGRDPDLLQGQVKTIEDGAVLLDQAFRYYTEAGTIFKQRRMFAVPGKSDEATDANVAGLDVATLTAYASSLQTIKDSLKADAKGLTSQSAVALSTPAKTN